MWTTQNRARYDRSRLRYPSDVTDEEWRLIEPLIPPRKPGGDKRTVDVREVVNGLMYVLSTGCQWRAIPKDLPRARRSTIISTCGAGRARSIASTTRFTCAVARRPRARRARPPPSSPGRRARGPARASRARKKGGVRRSARLRRGQENQ